MKSEKNEKGQGVIDFMMTYGWSILLILLILLIFILFMEFGIVNIKNYYTDENCLNGCKLIYPNTTKTKVKYVEFEPVCICYDEYLCKILLPNNLIVCKNIELGIVILEKE